MLWSGQGSRRIVAITGQESPRNGDPRIVTEISARHGSLSDLPAFVQASPAAIDAALLRLLQGASSQQITSWRDSVRWLQHEYNRCVREEPTAET